MRVVMPTAVGADERAWAALVAQAPHAERVDVSGDPLAYWRLLCELWAAGEDLILVEHDVILGPGTLLALDACPESWCSCPAADSEWTTGFAAAWLQCNRWRADFIAAHPKLLADVPEPGRMWAWLDTQAFEDVQPGPHIHLDHRTTHLTAPRRSRPIRRALLIAWLMPRYPGAWKASARTGRELDRRSHEARIWRQGHPSRTETTP